MPKKHPYTCPRCEYSTSKKGDMFKHLHELKKVCPATKQDVQLTDTIKQYILDNRVYHMPKQTQQQVINQQINNYQVIINYINKKDVQDKIEQYLEHTDDNLLEYVDTIENKYKHHADKLETRSKPFRKHETLNLDGFINVLHTCTSSSNVREMNIIYDKVLDRIQIYQGEWECYLFDNGVKELIEKIQEIYLDYYEEYLLKQYVSGSMFDKQCIKEALKDYYEFLECFDVEPRICTSPDEWIQELLDGDIGKLHRKVKDELKASKLKSVRKSVFNVIKTNCTASVIELNKKMMELIKVDDTFRDKIVAELQGVHLA